MAGRVLYCIVLVTSGGWASRYEAWNIRVAFGSIIRKRCKTSMLCPEIREGTDQNSSTGDSAYSDPELLRDYIRVQPDAFRLPSNAGYVVRTELAQARGKDLCQIHATVGSRSTSLAKRIRIQPSGQANADSTSGSARLARSLLAATVTQTSRRPRYSWHGR